VRGNAARALAPALAALALIGVVAVAATGSTQSGSGATRAPGDAFFDTIFSLSILLVIPSTALLVYGLMQRRAISREMASGRYRRTSAVAFIVFMLVFTIVVYLRFRDWERNPIDEGITDPLRPQTPVAERPGGAPEVAYEPRFAWVPVLVALGLAAVGLAAVVIAARRRTPAARDDALAEALVEALDDSLDDLKAESDPRRAVIAAYARLERVLAAHGHARGRAETPAEYLRRLLGDLDVGAQSVRRLTDLFTRAKFSHHEVDAGMKEEAIDGLAHMRDELRAASERRVPALAPHADASAERLA
jgi:uncharacterized membrane protein YidH (DUF202 family)